MLSLGLVAVATATLIFCAGASPIKRDAAKGPLALVIQNNTPSSNVSVYFTARDPNGGDVFLGSNGQWTSTCAGRSGSGMQPIPATLIAYRLKQAGSVTPITLPRGMVSGRMYTSINGLDFFTVDGCGLVQPYFQDQGSANYVKNWGFLEFTLTQTDLWVNPTSIDFVGLAHGFVVETPKGNMTTMGMAHGAVQTVCDRMHNITKQTGDLAWSSLCLSSNGIPVRVVGPEHHDDPKALASYWQSYVDAVWTKYRNQPLHVDTQGASGIVDCQVRGDIMFCDNEQFAKPNSSDIWGCASGTFANAGSGKHIALAARISAAFHRGTLLLDGGDKQPFKNADLFYSDKTVNHYAKAVHDVVSDGRLYAFPYDDVNAYAVDASGTISSGDVTRLFIGVGGPVH
ncbi:hypothetical protein LTR78_004608 [Recurvomyces mirabilis]|uniref:GH64 domain-containing protein n=1 Tax=Recurvomyces mirabilis TaxID=574656 RepID=A0AAE0WPD6_9PEZI|nr:hypothetical protein LTR78_004608 [Recurvomyces mirabilis]KAK5152897.1 hypothetical protein LTS14_008005 [Recurvomyces mirabilis]